MKRSFVETEVVRKAKKGAKNLEEVVASINNKPDETRRLSREANGEKENAEKQKNIRVEVAKVKNNNNNSKQANDPWSSYENLFRFKMPKYYISDIQNAILFGLSGETYFNPR